MGAGQHTGTVVDACLQCPVYDMVDNVNFVGFHQTVTRSGAITVKVLYVVWLF